MKLVFATHNQHKVEEIQKMLPDFEIVSLTDIGFYEEIDETGKTFEENATIKAETIYKSTGLNVFSDDSGLTIQALGGAPGIYSARYAGTGNDKDNIIKVLDNMNGKSNRSATFVCVICLILNGEKIIFEGKINGEILSQQEGEDGFGYDPIFKPEYQNVSFAKMASEKKNEISHRAIAVKKLKNYLLNFI
ncbi:RdgB/HAM1 family non-canonical purine NTP pyrophosphatase [Ornithobacterium rhinotracheale]|uniref:RdgB/HAM1 family non-canonical purine NTP pyrophosphatase n=1 Tax=Ornithobacterium rhinotracheale TaxID=28251 RepID=UPI00129C6199|nr:RdgB/HAM1 family non-canonical purine NTP pyrophosphatase [Ornithobacterium rhinotracheale]MRJ08648.1 RdgB/HAM1 family non-canonical purine NTP pyrophosphatase [Ornithobacterium rhinotracheale]MRJ11003.1 RdgB/HAM1 family non-canonical purine NTP pyrophosphatase [Ornithobacterium rhinotracheale]UOH76906.1 RdgB/HAM1 family non-canonical purine NTP pyrophosphatase [Ornithobacterium rhinotracheale]